MSLPPRELTVGDLARRSGVAVSTIHFYETKGLIRGWRTAGNQRRYPRGMLRRVAVIKAAQRTGIPLAVIAEAMAKLPEDHAPSAADWRAMSSAWRAELDARILTLTRLRDALTECIGCGCLSLTACPLRNPGDAMSGLGPGARLLEPS